jgi:isoamylase
VPVDHGREWRVVVDTAEPRGLTGDKGTTVRAGDRITLTDRSVVVLQRPA